MKDKEEEAAESVQGRPHQFPLQQQQQSQTQENDAQQNPELLIPHFLASLAKENQHNHHHHHQSVSSSSLQINNDREQEGQQCRSDLPLLVPMPVSSRPPPCYSNIGDGIFKHQLMPLDNNNNNGSEFGDDDGFGGSAGSRWPRQETLALLKIRQEMDASFRDATLKAHLWEEVSRRLGDLGYNRSAKKCKEKFENVNKYYKRTKAGRSGRHVGKTYKFFDQLEALYGNSGGELDNNGMSSTPAIKHNHNNSIDDNNSMAAAASGSSHEVPAQTQGTETHQTSAAAVAATVLSSMSLSSESSEETYDDSEHPESSGRKRKRASTKKMMVFFQKMMEKVMEKQEAMQRRLLETIERREQERLSREEAWWRQEMARLTRESDLRSQERLVSASRDRALVELLQKVTGQAPEIIPPPQMPPPHQHHHHPPPQPQSQVHPQPQPQPRRQETNNGEGAEPSDPNSKRWPKQEVHALIQIRTLLEPRFHDAGPKGQLWDQISAEMSKQGYWRNAKRCKEKWENINKYFRKAKESNKERPENANTCPYFHQLDALYRKGILKYSFTEKPLLILDNQQQEQTAKEEGEEEEKTHMDITAAKTQDNNSEIENNANSTGVGQAPAKSQEQDFVYAERSPRSLHTDLDLSFAAAARDASSSGPASFMAMVTDHQHQHQITIPGGGSSQTDH